MEPIERKGQGSHLCYEQVAERAETIRLRGEWIEAARRRLWDRMDRLRRLQAQDAAAAADALPRTPAAAPADPELEPRPAALEMAHPHGPALQAAAD